MAAQRNLNNWQRRREPLEQRYPLTAHYSTQPSDMNTSYTGYQLDNMSGGIVSHYPEPVSRHRSPPQPSQALPDYYHPTLPQQPYIRNERTSSFASRMQRNQYASLPENEYHSRPAVPRDRQMQFPMDDFETAGTDRESVRVVEDDMPSNYGASVSQSIGESVQNDATAGEADKPILVLTSNREISEPVPSNDSPYIRSADVFLNRTAKKIALKKAFHWLSPRFFHEKAWFGWLPAHSYQPPRRYFSTSTQTLTKHKHLDAFHRAHEGYEDDQFLDPLNGRVRRLFVQTIDRIYDMDNDTSWRRTYITDVSPWILRVAWWSRAGLLTAKQDRYAKRGKVWKNWKSKTAALSDEQWTQLGIRWLPACIGLLILMCFPTDVEGQVRNHGFYDPVPYRFWRYPKVARNYRENKDFTRTQNFSHTDDIRLSSRSLLPRFLCFPKFCSDSNPRGRLEPLTWMTKQESNAQPAYIFVSYTGEGQFGRPCETGGENYKKNGTNPCNCGYCTLSKSDADALHEIAQTAAKNAGVSAYWTDQCCMSTDKAEFSEDIYRISDVVRGAQKIVVVVGRSGGMSVASSADTIELLKEWGKRMWTWPEVLLAPIGKEILVYTRGMTANAFSLSKLEFAREVWTDASVARYLVDHFENSMALSRLELVVLALECLTDRVINGTTPFSDGDLSYALMGLLRQRPRIDDTDTAFQAFARLSLANDSDQLLERMICLLPTGRPDKVQPVDPSLSGEAAQKAIERARVAAEQQRKHYWTNMDDHWGAKLWDIEPLCQVAGIAAQDTVILDGAYGATVHWNSFQRVAITTRETWSRMMGRMCVRLTPAWFFIGSLLVATSGGNPTTTGFGALFLIASLVLILLSPILMLHIYSGKVWNSQPWLFGLEGYMSIKEIERKIFGFECDRLTWAPYCSAMSDHRVNPERYLDDECEGTDPFPNGYKTPASRHDGSTSQGTDGKRLFTIVDTFTMTVTTFYAERPPVIALLCGSEGGMQRAVMCSYDWTTQTMFRETVLRMETRTLERMPRIGRVRFGLKRGEGKT